MSSRRYISNRNWIMKDSINSEHVKPWIALKTQGIESTEESIRIYKKANVAWNHIPKQ